MGADVIAARCHRAPAPTKAWAPPDTALGVLCSLRQSAAALSPALAAPSSRSCMQSVSLHSSTVAQHALAGEMAAPRGPPAAASSMRWHCSFSVAASACAAAARASASSSCLRLSTDMSWGGGCAPRQPQRKHRHPRSHAWPACTASSLHNHPQNVTQLHGLRGIAVLSSWAHCTHATILHTLMYLPSVPS